MNKKVVVVVLIAGVALGGAYAAWNWYQTHEEAVAHEPDGITAYGNVDVRQVDLAFRVEGRLSELLFEEGDRVEKGALVGLLDSKPYDEEVDLRQAELNSALADLQRLEAGYRPQEIKTARAVVAEREATIATLETEFKRREALTKDGVLSQQSFDDIRARRDEAEARLQSAREELDLRLEGFRQEDITQARAQVAAREAQLRIARTRLDDTRLLAPSHGTVLTRALEPGSIAHAGDTVITVSLTDPVWVRAYIPEPDLGRIHPGMEALVYTDSRPGAPSQGHVGYISPEAEFTPKTVETPDLRTRLVYRFRVIVDNPDQGLRQGMPVTVTLMNDTESSPEASLPGEPKP